MPPCFISQTMNFFVITNIASNAFIALTLLVGWQEGHLACKKTEWWGAGVVICLERDADLHMAQLMPLPLTVSCFSKIQIGFTFLVPARLGSPGKGPLNGCVCVCVLILLAYMLVSNTVDSGTGRAYVLQFSSRREPVDYKDCVMTDP